MRGSDDLLSALSLKWRRYVCGDPQARQSGCSLGSDCKALGGVETLFVLSVAMRQACS